MRNSECGIKTRPGLDSAFRIPHSAFESPAMRSLQAISDLFPHARENGLTDAQATDSRNRFGANRLTPLPREPVWKKFLEKFDEPIIKILLGASLLKIVVDLFVASPAAGGTALAAVVLVMVAAFVAK